ncbi:MAG: hypothetical protein R3F56_19790 [Planctomycetota bacterium]
MSTQRVRTRVSFVLLAFLAACGEDAAPAAGAGPAAEPPATVSAELTAKLAAADKKDGTEDKVVHMCAGCGLGMAGKAENTLQVGGYAMHFCKHDCQERFRRDAVGELTRLKVD